MGTGYTRTNTADIQSGTVVKSAPLNAELNAVVDAFAASTGHTHDGTSAEGGPIAKLLSNTLTFGAGTAGTDITITFDGETNDGALKWMEDEDYFEFSDDILIATNEKLQFRDTGIYIYSNADGDLDIVSDGTASNSINLDSAGGITLDADTASEGITYADNATAILQIFHSSSDVIFKNKVDAKDIVFQQYDGNEVMRVADNRRVYFFDEGGEYISSDGTDFTFASGNDINLTATEDINVPADVGITFGDDGEKIEGDGTNLTISSSNNLTIDAAGDIILDADGDDITLKNGSATFGSLTNSSGELVIKSGSTPTTAMTFSGANVTFAGTITIGSAGISEAELEILDGASISTDELNILDGDTTPATVTVADGDGLILNDGGNGGTLKQITVQSLAAYLDDEITAMPNLVTTAATTVGALDSGSITSGFGNIDNGASNITSGGLVKLDVDADADDLTGDSATGRLTIGAGEDLNLYHGGTNSYIVNDTGDLILDTADDIVLDAAGGDIFFKADGATFGSATNSSGNLILKSGTTTALTFSGANVTVAGNLTVSGTTTTVNTTNTVISDTLIELGNGVSGTPSNDSGIVIERGSADNAFIGFDESADKFLVGTGSFTGASTGDLTVTTGTLVANIEGNLTGTIQTAAQTNITSVGTLGALTVDDVAIDGKVITMTGDTSDTVTITAGTNGTLAITTTDDAGANGNITITADGTFEAVGTTITLDSGAGVNLETDALSIGNNGDTDVAVTFNANSADGVLTWMEDEDYFQFSDDILMASTEKIQFGDTASFIQQSSDGTLRIDGEAIIDLNASTRVDVSNDLKVGGEVQTAKVAYTDGTDAITVASGGGITANVSLTLASGSTVTAIKDEDNMSSDSNSSLATQQSIKAYVDSVAATSNNVTGLNATGAELNAVADFSAVSVDTSTAIANNDAILMFDNGNEIGYRDVDLLVTYMESTIDGLSSLTTTGALNSGSITSGFGAIDNGTSGIRTNTFTAETSIVPDASGGADIGASGGSEWGDVFIADDKYIQFGSDQNVLVGYDEDGNDTLEIKANVEGAALGITFSADQADDNADTWRLSLADGGTWTWDSYTSGSFATKQTLDTAGNLTVTGELDAASLDISGDADIDGTTNLDVVDIDGAVDMASTLAVSGVLTASAGIDLNGTELILDADADTSITADSDDVIDFRAGGTDIVSMGGANSGMDIKSSLGLRVVNGSETMYSAVCGNDGATTFLTNRTDGTSAHGSYIFNTRDGGSTLTRMTVNASGNVVVNNTLDAAVVDGENFKINGAQGSDGQVLTSTGSGVAWEDAAGGGAFTLISDDTLSSSATTISRTNCFTTTYDDYLVIFRAEAHSTTGDNMQFQFIQSDGSVFSTSDYAYDKENVGNQYDKDGIFDDQEITVQRQNYQSMPTTLWMYVTHPRNNTYWTSVHGTFHTGDTGAPETFVGAYRVEDAQVHGLKFLLTGSQEFAAGSYLKVYGIQKS